MWRLIAVCSQASLLLRASAVSEADGSCSAASVSAQPDEFPDPSDKRVWLVANGDLRGTANDNAWPAQQALEKAITTAAAREGYEIVRANDLVKPLHDSGRNLISSQRQGLAVVGSIPSNARVLIAVATWQYSHHILGALEHHRGPILTVANWNGANPGLVGLLNLNGGLTKVGRRYSTTWTGDGSDAYFIGSLRQWLSSGNVPADESKVRDYDALTLVAAKKGSAEATGIAAANSFAASPAILGVLDEGCMGMQNAIIEDSLLNKLHIYKERLSQSALLAEMALVTDKDAKEVYDWLVGRKFTFYDGATQARTSKVGNIKTEDVMAQCKMYIATVRMADLHGCDGIGIQYQQGLKDMAPASDLAEGLMNDDVDRPPVFHRETGTELYAGRSLPHMNEVDECAGVDMLVTHRLWRSLGWDSSNTLHDVRFGATYGDQYVWVFLISGAAPAAMHIGGYGGSYSMLQPTFFWPAGGGGLSGVAKPGNVVWSRVFIMGGKLHCDMGRLRVIELPAEETQKRLDATSPQWPIMHAVLEGNISRDQFMGRHKANHIQVVYVPDAQDPDFAMRAKAAAMHTLGIEVHIIGL